jgi:hypothetical protein
MITKILFLIISLNLVFAKNSINNDKEHIIYSKLKDLNIEKNSKVKDYYDNYDYDENENIDYDYNEFQLNDEKYENEMKNGLFATTKQ